MDHVQPGQGLGVIGVIAALFQGSERIYVNDSFGNFVQNSSLITSVSDASLDVDGHREKFPSAIVTDTDAASDAEPNARSAAKPDAEDSPQARKPTKITLNEYKTDLARIKETIQLGTMEADTAFDELQERAQAAGLFGDGDITGPGIIVTHDQNEALSMADRIAVMEDGKICQIAKPSELYEFPNASRTRGD